MDLYIKAIASDTVSLLSGIGSVILLLLDATYFRKKPTPRWIVLILALVCLVFASYRVWSAEHVAKIELEGRLKSLTVPQLVGSFGSMDGQPAEGRSKGVVITGNFDIKNLGAPSIADGFALTLVTPSREILGTNLPQQQRLKFKAKGDDDTGELEVIVPDSYYLPLYKNATIPTNGQISGFMTVLFDDITLEDAFRPENRLRLTFVDAQQRTYTFEHALIRMSTKTNGKIAPHPRNQE